MSQNNKKLFAVIFFSLLLLFPLFHAHADFSELIGKAVSRLLIGDICKFIIHTSQFFLYLASTLLKFVMSEHFVAWNYTGMPPGNNPLVTTGWKLTRDLVNMFFIVILAFIGLATALKIEQYRYEKLLPKLILIALIINFSPVICGIFIDASNIVMNFFTGSYKGFEAVVNQLTTQHNAIISGIGNQDLSAGEGIQRAVQLWALVGFNAYVTILLFVLSLLFMLRYVFIWLHVILSPIAFFSYIVPGFSGYWTKWWKGFLQWCFVGVVAAFFLYLGNKIFEQSSAIIQSSAITAGGIAAGNLGDFWLSTIQTLLPLGFGVGFITAGLGIALSTSVAGASYAIRAARWAGATVVAGAGAAAGVAKAGVGWAGKKVGEGAERVSDRVAASKWNRDFVQGLAKGKPGEAEKDASGWEKFGRRVTGNLPGWAKKPFLEKPLDRQARVGDKITAREKEFEQIADFETLAAKAELISPSDFEGRAAMATVLSKKAQGKGLNKVSKSWLEGTVAQMGKLAPYKIPDIVKRKADLIESEDPKVIAAILKGFGIKATEAGDKKDDDVIVELVKKYEKEGVEPEKARKKALKEAARYETVKQMTVADMSEQTNETLKELVPALARRGSVDKIKKIYEERPEIASKLTEEFEKFDDDALELVKENDSLARRIASGNDPVLKSMIQIKGLETIDQYNEYKRQLAGAGPGAGGGAGGGRRAGDRRAWGAGRPRPGGRQAGTGGSKQGSKKRGYHPPGGFKATGGGVPPAGPSVTPNQGGGGATTPSPPTLSAAQRLQASGSFFDSDFDPELAKKPNAPVSPGKTIGNPVASGYNRMMAIGDIHGAYDQMAEIVQSNPDVDRFVFMGDYMDRDKKGVQAAEAVFGDGGLVDQGKAVGLIGNHEVLFLATMRGQKGAFSQWYGNGGDEVLGELGISSEREARNNPRLQKLAQQMQQKLNVYHQENDTLFTHSGLPIGNDGKLMSYKGKTGLAAFDEVQKDLRAGTLDYMQLIEADRAEDRGTPIWTGDSYNRNRKGANWSERINETELDGLLKEFGAKRIVHGHIPDAEGNVTQQFGGKVINIDAAMADFYAHRGSKGADAKGGGALVFDEKGIHAYERKEGQRRTLEALSTSEQEPTD